MIDFSWLGVRRYAPVVQIQQFGVKPEPKLTMGRKAPVFIDLKEISEPGAIT